MPVKLNDKTYTKWARNNDYNSKTERKDNERKHQNKPDAEFKDLNPVQTWFILLEIIIRVSRFEPVLNWCRLMTVQRRGSNSLNSASN